jgi:hypothetical protein
MLNVASTDLLEHMSFADGKAYNEKLMALAENKGAPDGEFAMWPAMKSEQ